MAIPDYQEIMLPLIRYASDEQEHHVAEAYDNIAQVFDVSDDERQDLLPSGQDKIFSNRVRWSLFYLKKAGLLESPRRSYFRITAAELHALQKQPATIDVQFLKQCPEFLEFLRGKPKDKGTIIQGTDSGVQTPDEVLEDAYQESRRSLAQELLATVKACSPQFFEKLVVDLLLKMDYGGSRKDAGEAVGKSGDGGIDGIIKEDPLGLGVLYLQAKRWEASVGSPEIQKFVGALHGKKARRGVFISTSTFTSEALNYAKNIEDKVVLIDGDALAQLMIDHDVGVSKVAEYAVKKIDSDYFTED
jgi:restriction system protein